MSFHAAGGPGWLIMAALEKEMKMITPDEARKHADLVEADFCSCIPAYKDRGMVDPQCLSCMTEEERYESARVARDLAQQVEDLQADAARLDWLLESALVIHMHNKYRAMKTMDRAGIDEAMK